MVLLTTNEKNPAALKLLIAIKYGQVDVQIKIVQVNGKLHQPSVYNTWPAVSNEHLVF